MELLEILNQVVHVKCSVFIDGGIIITINIIYYCCYYFAAGAWDSDKGEITTNLECGQEECH